MESQILLGTSTTPWFARRVTSGSDTLLVSAIAAGGDTACVIRFNGEVACWGASGLGQAGVASATASSPKTISNYSTILGSSIRLGIGSTTSCVIGANSAGTNGTVLCWGQNSMGQLGRGSTSPTSDFLADPVDM
jgi:alpha-tubulin suppressor-like RCC1 family protein